MGYNYGKMTRVEIVTFKGSGKMHETHRYRSSIDAWETNELTEEAKANIPQCKEMDFTLKAEDDKMLNFFLIRFKTTP